MTQREFLVKWIAALRSGNYKQGTGRLYEIVCKTYCCLGVACDIAIKEGVNVRRNFKNGRIYGGLLDNWVYQFVPNVAPRFGEYTIKVIHNGRETSLSHLNDNDGLSFSEIADLIEQQLLPLTAD